MSAPQDDLFFGKIALNLRFITKDLLEKALHYQKTQAPQMPLGELLLQKGVLTREQIEKVLEVQQRVRSARQGPGGAPANGGGSQPNDSWSAYAQFMQPGSSPGSVPGGPLASSNATPHPATRGSGSGPQLHASGNVTALGSGRFPASPPVLEATAEVEPDSLVGQTIGGCQIAAKIGEGGMGAIYRARHEALRKDVVVKILPPESAANPRTVERFFREARAAAKLEHPNIVQVLNVGTTERGLNFIVMQYIDGRNLEDVIAQKGRHPWKEALRIVSEVARGLQAAHRAGVVHRDIKADNILMTSTGVVKLADFGLAKDLNSDLKLTADGAMIGTPLYMAPEIGRVKEIDGRVDIYSLGVTFYYLLTGVQPFREFAAMEILSAKAHDKLKPPEQFAPDLPDKVRNVVGKMLSKDRDKRYENMDGVLRDLEALDRDFPVDAGPPALWAAGNVAASGTGRASKVGAPSSRRQPAVTASADKAASSFPPLVIVGLVVTGGLVLVLGVVLVVVLFFHH